LNNGKITSDLTEICSNVCVEDKQNCNFFLLKTLFGFYFLKCRKLRVY